MKSGVPHYQTVPLFAVLIFVFIPTAAKTQEHSLWKDIGLYGGQIPTIAVAPDSSAVYAGSWGGDGLFKSTDGGATWFGIPQDNPSWFRNYEIYDIAVDPNNPATIWVANSHFIDMSRDGGQTWQTFFFARDERRFCYTVAVDPHDPSGDTVYVGTGGPDYTDEYGEVFVTRDGGETWDKMNISSDVIWHNFWKITFNPGKKGEVWIANRTSYLSQNGKIIVSPDDGATWWYWDAAYWEPTQTYYRFGYLDEIVINPADPLKLYASSQYGIARKMDGSNLNTRWWWTSVTDSCRALCIPGTAPEILYAGLLETIAKTTDDGLTWDTSSPAPAEFLTLQADPVQPEHLFGGSVNKGVFATSDAAKTWHESNTGIKANTIYDTVVEKTPAGVRIVCGTLAGVYRSDDGAAWERIYGSSAESVLLHPKRPDIIYAGTGFGTGWEVLKSINGGNSWKYISAPDGAQSTVASIALIPQHNTDNDTLLMGIAYGSGKKGEVIQITGWGYNSYQSLHSLLQTDVPVNAVAVHPQNPQFLFAGTGSFFAPVVPGGLYRSCDGGTTWTRVLVLQKYVVNSIAIAPSQPDIIFIGCGGSNTEYAGVFKTTDGGTTWTAASSGLPKHYAVRDLKIDPSNSAIAYAALYKGYNESGEDLGGTYVTLDGGMYWTRIGLSDYRMFDVSALGTGMEPSRTATASSPSVPTSTLYAGTASGMYQATTAGTGIITGSIVSSTGLPIDSAQIITSAGCGTQSVQGYYLLMMPAGMHSLQVMAAGFTPLMLPSVTVAAGQCIEQTIVMTPASPDNGTNCLASQLLTGNDRFDNLELLRTFRDGALHSLTGGAFFINSYYSLGADIMQVLGHNRYLRDRALSLIIRALPFAAHPPNVLPSGTLDLMSSFLVAVESCAPPDTKIRLSAMRCRMRHVLSHTQRHGDSHP
ncbi:MAG: hypothetical protein N3B18_06190 [Desulfobacterota bacterium]|nr:hypothetical protein [Thermodesulfobacteriota bacterium]